MPELKDTVGPMLSSDYKERFQAEYWQLLIRLRKLQWLIAGYKDGKLPFQLTCPIMLLEMQAKHMERYLVALNNRAAIEGISLEEEPEMSMSGATRDNLLVTIGSRAAYMNVAGEIGLPAGSIGEDILAEFAVLAATQWMIQDPDEMGVMSFDEFIETALKERFGNN